MDTKKIEEIIAVFEQSSLTKMELDVDDMKIKMEKEAQASTTQEFREPTKQIQSKPEEVKEESKPEKAKGYWVKAPIVGTFYSSRAVGVAPFVQIGQTVKKGDVLCIIEAMKVMNEIHSPVDGVIAEILVTNESMVEYNQDLIRIGETL